MSAIGKGDWVQARKSYEGRGVSLTEGQVYYVCDAGTIGLARVSPCPDCGANHLTFDYVNLGRTKNNDCWRPCFFLPLGGNGQKVGRKAKTPVRA